MGVYDSGSNVSLINSRLLSLKSNPNKNNNSQANLKTINGVKKSTGIVSLKIKIFQKEKNMNVFVIDEQNYDYDFLIGLDCIKAFQLIHNENLEITQKVKKKLRKYSWLHR